MDQTPAGPPPRPAYRSRPISTPRAPESKRLVHLSAIFWMLASLCALPTVWYAWRHLTESSDALYDRLSKRVDNPADLSSLRDLTDSTPSILTVVALVLAVAQLLCVAQLVRTGSQAARWSLLFSFGLGLIVVIFWYLVTYGLPHVPFGIYQVAIVAQVLFMLLGTSAAIKRS